MRVPGVGWPADARASASASDPGARMRKWPAAEPPTSTVRSAHSNRVTNSSAPSPLTSASAVVGEAGAVPGEAPRR